MKKKENRKELNFSHRSIFMKMLLLFLILISLVSLIWQANSFLLIYLSKTVDPLKDALNMVVTLFSIVVATWAGLNIYNVIAKDDLNVLKKDTYDKLEELGNRAKTIETTLNDQIKNSLDRQRAEEFKITQTSILDKLSETINFYPTSTFLIDKFNNIEQEQYWGILHHILQIEHLFGACSIIMRDNGNPYTRAAIAKSCLSQCDALFLKINCITDINIKNLLLGYAYLRKADFNFYIGYRLDAKYLEEAINLYSNSAKSFFGFSVITTDGINQETIEEWITKQFLLYNQIKGDNELKQNFKNEILCMCYLCNIIGECYNVQLQPELVNHVGKIEKEEYSRHANICFSFAISIADNLIETSQKTGEKDYKKLPAYFATYFRNYGTSMERLPDSYKHKDEILETYIIALHINSKDFKAHQTYIALTIKTVDTFYKDKSLNAKQSELKSYRNILLSLIPHSEILLRKQPNYEPGYNYACWLYTLLIAFSENEEERLKWAEKAQENMCFVKSLFPTNNIQYGNEIRLKQILDRFNITK